MVLAGVLLLIAAAFNTGCGLTVHRFGHATRAA
jgi:hypothetical protein